MRFTALFVLSATTILIPPQGQRTQLGPDAAVLSLPLLSTSIARTHVPLSQALGVVGSYVQRGYVLFGLELHSNDGEEPIVSIDISPDSSFGDGLRQIMGQIPGYEYEIISEHMVNIYPVGAKNDLKDILNTAVPKFDAIGVDAGSLLTRPSDFIPELARRLRPKSSAGPQPSGYGGSTFRSSIPPITVHLQDTTVRQILNATSQAMAQLPPNHQPVGWSYMVQPDPTSPTGGKHTWAFLFSAPRNWKQVPVNSSQ